MIQEKDFLYRVPVKTAPITTPGGQIRNPEILVDVEGGEFMHGNILDANSTNKLINQSVKDAVDNKLIESGYVTQDLLEAETSARTKGDEDLSSKIKAEQTRAEGKEKEISDKLAIVNGDSNTEGSFRKAIADVVAAAPEDLDTLKEIADKLAGNDDLHTALNQAITEKADASALLNEVSRATGAESGLQAAIATKADATALSNYVLTTALNQQVDTLNTAINAKQDAGNYIPYDSSDDNFYKIDKALKILAGGLTGIITPGYINICSDGGPDNVKIDPVNGIAKTGANGDFQLNETGLTGTNTVDQKNLKFSINPDQILLQKGDNNLAKISSDEMLLQKDGSDIININHTKLMYTTGVGNLFVGSTGRGFEVDITDEGNGNYAVINGHEIYVKDGVAITQKGIITNPGQSSPTYIYNKADRALIANKVIDQYGDLRDGIKEVDKKITANTTAIEGKQDKGNYITYDNYNGHAYTLHGELMLGEEEFSILTLSNTGIALGGPRESGFSLSSDSIEINNGQDIVNINPVQISSTANEVNQFKITPGSIILGNESNPTVKISIEGIKFAGRTDGYIPTAGGSFIELGSLANVEDIKSLSVGLSRKQNKITVNEVDITDIETADITKLRTIVTNLINALSESDLIRKTETLE